MRVNFVFEPVFNNIVSIFVILGELNTISVIFVQFLKALSSTAVTETGRKTYDRPLQFSNAFANMLVILVKLILVKPVLFLKAEEGITLLIAKEVLKEKLLKNNFTQKDIDKLDIKYNYWINNDPLLENKNGEIKVKRKF